jgi:hypothetical protein
MSIRRVYIPLILGTVIASTAIEAPSMLDGSRKPKGITRQP